MNSTLLALALGLLVVAVAAGTVAFTAGDELEGGEVYVQPAETANGDAYAELDDGDLIVEIDGLNPSATTSVDNVVRLGSAAAGDTVAVGIDHDAGEAVTVTRMDTGESIDTGSPTVSLEPTESVRLGIEIATDAPEEVLEEVTLRATVQDDAPAPSSSTDSTSSSPSFDVTGELETDAVEPGGTVLAEASVANRGDRAGTYSVTLSTGSGLVLESRSVHVDAGGSKAVTLGATIDDPGRYRLSVAGDDVGSVEVVADAGPATGVGATAGGTESESASEELESASEDPESASEDPESATNGSDTPGSSVGDLLGVGAILALLAVLALATLAERRR